MPHLPKTVIGLLVAGLVHIVSARTSAQPLDKTQIEEFMLTAEIVAAEPIGRGVTQPWRLTLSDGTLMHDVAFQSVNERAAQKRLGRRTG